MIDLDTETTPVSAPLFGPATTDRESESVISVHLADPDGTPVPAAQPRSFPLQATASRLVVLVLAHIRRRQVARRR